MPKKETNFALAKDNGLTPQQGYVPQSRSVANVAPSNDDRSIKPVIEASKNFGLQATAKKMDSDVEFFKDNNNMDPWRFPKLLFNWCMTFFGSIYEFLKSVYKYIKANLKTWVLQALNSIRGKSGKKNIKTKGPTKGGEPLIGGTPSKSTSKYPRTLYALSIFPGLLTILIVIFLLIFMLWVATQAFVRKVSWGKINLPDIPISFDKKTTQIVYSIFYVITSSYLMFYLLFGYFNKIGSELDIIQIFKQFIAASYVLWPIAVLIIGSAVSKAFYKMACAGGKTNILGFAKFIESRVVNILGITVLLTLVLLIKPIKKMYESSHPVIKDRFVELSTLLAVIIKFIVIYILLRVVSIMLEDIASDKLVFFIAKLTNKVKPPPENCNKEEKKYEKQSEISTAMEEVYMYISGIIIWLILFFIVLVQCPHPYMASFINTNNNIGNAFFNLTKIATKYFAENKFGKKNNTTKKPGLLAGLLNKSSEQAPSSTSNISGALPTQLPTNISGAIPEQVQAQALRQNLAKAVIDEDKRTHGF